MQQNHSCRTVVTCGRKKEWHENEEKHTEGKQGTSQKTTEATGEFPTITDAHPPRDRRSLTNREKNTSSIFRCYDLPGVSILPSACGSAACALITAMSSYMFVPPGSAASGSLSSSSIVSSSDFSEINRLISSVNSRLDTH